MKLKSIIILLTLATSVAFGSPSPTAKKNSDRLLKSIETADFQLFLEDAEPEFKEIEKKSFDSVANQLRPRMKKGYEVFFLGTLSQRGYSVSLWKLKFSKGDDALATLCVKGDKVGGYWIK